MNATIQKSKDEQIQITVKEYKGKEYLDVRVWYKPTEDVEYMPTRKGFVLPMELLPDLKRAINAIS